MANLHNSKSVIAFYFYSFPAFGWSLLIRVLFSSFYLTVFSTSLQVSIFPWSGALWYTSSLDSALAYRYFLAKCQPIWGTAWACLSLPSSFCSRWIILMPRTWSSPASFSDYKLRPTLRGSFFWWHRWEITLPVLSPPSSPQSLPWR